MPHATDVKNSANESLSLDEPAASTRRWSQRVRSVRDDFDEWLRFDSALGAKLIAASGILVGEGWRLCRDTRRYLEAISAVHRRSCSSIADRFIERRLGSMLRTNKGLFETVSLSRVPGPENAFVRDPTRLLRTRMLVIKSPGPAEKGVISLDYSFTFPLVAKFFDIQRIAERYYLLFEPSWSGYCDLDVLGYLAYDFPVFVQAGEPRDAEFIRRIGANLVPIPVAANWWVDYRVFRPLEGVKKDRDIVMVAGWSRFKRHGALFHALAKLKKRGERLNVTLVGYPGGDLGKEGVLELARYHGVSDQVEVHEYVPANEVNLLYNRAKVNIVWSRREGFNRSIIEGFFANTPGIMRAGFNYGHRHDYMNDSTGLYAPEDELPDRLLEIVRNGDRLSPRQWVESHMTCQQATKIVSEAIGAYAVAQGEKWSKPLAVKVSHLNTQRYWDESEADAFDGDYEFLRSTIRVDRVAA